MLKSISVALLILLASGSAPAQDNPAQDNPVEVGAVRWQRDFDGALTQSKTGGRPVLAFFQEVPGCSGCQTFGREVMSHPSLVAAIEAAFVPVLIYNNQPGADAALCERFGEPTSNFQVIRFLDGEGRDIIPRKDRVWTVVALATRMVEALEAAGRPVPGYLAVVADELAVGDHQRIAFAQPCFWAGEAALGQIDGVVRTEAGWIESREVTVVHFNRARLSLDELVAEATRRRVADKIYVADAPDLERLALQKLSVGRLFGSYRMAKQSDQKRQIAGSVFTQLDLTPMQATKVNAFVGDSLSVALGWLTPTQRARWDELRTR